MRRGRLSPWFAIAILGVAGVALLGVGGWFALEAYSSRHTAEAELVDSRIHESTDSDGNTTTSYQVKVTVYGHGSQWVTSETLYGDYDSPGQSVTVQLSDATGDVVHVRGKDFSVEIAKSTGRVVAMIVMLVLGVLLLGLALFLSRILRRQMRRALA